MTTKRPWTPGPWRGKSRLSLMNIPANYKLVTKAPEMAELLIEQVNDPYGMPLGRLERFKELLKEIGYEPDQTS